MHRAAAEQYAGENPNGTIPCQSPGCRGVSCMRLLPFREAIAEALYGLTIETEFGLTGIFKPFRHERICTIQGSDQGFHRNAKMSTRQDPALAIDNFEMPVTLLRRAQQNRHLLAGFRDAFGQFLN